MAIEHLSKAQKIGIHFIWYSFLLPVCGTLVFILVRALLDRNFSLAVALSVSTIGSLMIVLFIFPVLLIIAAISLLGIGFLPRRAAIILNGLLVLVVPWVLLWKGPSFFLDHPTLVVAVSVMFSGVSIGGYELLRIHAVFRGES